MLNIFNIKIFMTRHLLKVLLGELPLVKEFLAQQRSGKSCSKWACSDQGAESQRASHQSVRITKHHCNMHTNSTNQKKREGKFIGTVK